MQDPSKPIMLVILDGFGYKAEEQGNAIAHANMPNWKSWLKIYPNTLLKASGEAVGLLPDYMGNSEVGHLTIGTGRVIKSVLKKFHGAIEDKSFFRNEKLIRLFNKIKEQNAALHFMGLLSDAGVHSHQKHLYAFLMFARRHGLRKVFIHAFLDGRDTSPKSAVKYLNQLDEECKKVGVGQIASVHGRFYAMDRDKNWERTEESYKVFVDRSPTSTSLSWKDVLEKSYSKGETDEFVKPCNLISDGVVKQYDGVVFFNFRSDRARQLVESFINPGFKHFQIKKELKLSFFLTTTRYREDFDNEILFEKKKVKSTFSDVLAQNKKKVFVIAETEKYAHVTYFFRGEVEKKLPNETCILVPSIKSRNYVNYPEMSASKITAILLQSLQAEPQDFYLVNYANCDMVGHSANFEAAIKACECIDVQLKVLYDEVVEKQNGTLFITADHGNAEEMIDEKGEPKSSHTISPVPFMIIKKGSCDRIKMAKGNSLGISSIAPTILKFMQLSIPEEMDVETIF